MLRPVGLLAGVLILALPGFASATTRFVNRTDPTCGGQAPCSTTIQAAVTAAVAGDTIRIQAAGTYVEQVLIQSKNSGAGSTELDRIVIEADPAAPVGAVVVSGVAETCGGGTPKSVFQLKRSRFVTIRGLTILGNGGIGVDLAGGGDTNDHIRVERNRIVGTGSACSEGVVLETGTTETLVANNLIYGHGKNGIDIQGSNGGPQYVVENTVHGNGWNGLWVPRGHLVWVVDNILTQNGTAAGTSGGRAGVAQEVGNFPKPENIVLLDNLVCGNRVGEITGPALDGGDSGNLTPTGSEGPGVTASPGCETPSTVYAQLAGADGLLGTVDDDFTLAGGSPAVDSGIDPRTLGLSAGLDASFAADYTAPGVRPRNGSGAPTAQFDRGALELAVPDTTAPALTFQAPPANAFVRQGVAVQAQATDAGSGVASLGLTVDSQALAATLSPVLPPPAASVTATATWDTTTAADGAHTLGASATDQAGNAASVSRVVIVDNTPPETTITGGPTGEIGEASASFSFAGSDNLTPAGNLVFAWRLDGGGYGGFGGGTTATVTGLTEGAHTFEVKARDLAGNEDGTPAGRTFTVRFGPSITSVSPGSGPSGTLVTITGTNFEPGGTAVAFNGVGAVVRTATATTLTVPVPVGATTGPLVVTTARGTASAPFTVTLTGDFALTAAPAVARAIAGDQAAVGVGAGGTGTFTSLVSLTVSPAVAGIEAAFGAALVAPGANTSLTLAVASTVAAGSYGFTVTGAAEVDGRAVTRTVAFTLEVLAAETTAVTGRILTAEAVPQAIPGVTVTLGTAFALTDAGGNFVLLGPPSGQNLLFVDGRTASTPQAQYPIVEVPVTVGGSGPTRVPFAIYLPKLDTGNAISLPLDGAGFTTQEVRATTPRIPGLVVTVPQGTRIIGPDGNPVGQLVITPVPVDRSPMPFPAGVTASLLFAIHPGGAVPSQPLPITFPNVGQAEPGTGATLYYFDLAIGGWNTWGTGTVSAEGLEIVSDPGVGLPRLAWHFASFDAGAISLSDQVRSRNAKAGEPVDLVTGRFTVSKTDLVVPGRLPITIQRHYRSENPRAGLFGVGWNLDGYDTRLTTSGTSLLLILPDQSSYLLAPTGTGWENGTEPFLRGAVLTPLAGGFNFQLRSKDGTVQRFDRLAGFSNLAALSAITDRNGNTVTLTRDPLFPQQNRITRITEPGGRFFTLTYDAGGRIATVTDPLGRVVQYGYDGQGRLTTVTDPAGGITRYTYDASHRILTLTDPREITFLTTEYDPATGRVVRQTQADGGVWQFGYTVTAGVVTAATVTDPGGHATTHRFSAQGFTLSTTDALGQTTQFEYAPGSNLLTSRTDALGRTTRFTYDGQGNMTGVTDAAGQTRTYTYEPTFNQVTSVTVPLGGGLQQVTSFGYDARGNLTTITDPLGKGTGLSYTAAGQVASVTDPLGHVVGFGYDGVGNLVTVTDALGNVTQRSYDGASRLVTETDPRGKVSRIRYDALNRPTAIADPLGAVTRLTYDGNGNVLTVTDGRGGVTSYAYDAMDRVTTRTDAVGQPESYGYDASGNRTRVTDRKGQARTAAYDALDRLTQVTWADGSTTRYGYDAGGRLTGLTDSLGGTSTSTYDALDRRLSETTALGTVSYTYDAGGRRTGLAVPGQPATSYVHDLADRLRGITQGTLAVAMGYDDAGRRTSVTLPNGIVTQAAYDAAGRLTGLSYLLGTTTLGDLSYVYDAAGQRVAVGGSWARTGLPAAMAGATYDAANRQLTFGGQALTYDLNGNLTSDGTATYTWDARDQLVAVTGPVAATFGYDGAGRRRRQTIAGTTTEYVYDGLNAVQEGQGATVVDLLTGLGLDEHLARTDAGGTVSVLADALGSTVALSDADGTIPTAYTYEPFGGTAVSGASSGNAYQYTGRENDGTGLYYYRARYYHPGLHRFISEDPIRRAGGSVNFYLYVHGNPISFRDPLGLVVVGVSLGASTYYGYVNDRLANIGDAATISALYGLSTDGAGTMTQGRTVSAGARSYGTTPSSDSFVFGFGLAKLGPGFTISNASSFKSLEGDFDTTLINVLGIAVQFDQGWDATGRKVNVLTISPGLGLGVARLKTRTPPELLREVPYPCDSCPVEAMVPPVRMGSLVGAAPLGGRK